MRAVAAAIAFLVAAADALILAAHPRVAPAAVRMTLAEDDVAAQLPCLQSETGCELDTFDNLLAEMKAELEQLENREDQVKGRIEILEKYRQPAILAAGEVKAIDELERAWQCLEEGCQVDEVDELIRINQLIRATRL